MKFYLTYKGHLYPSGNKSRRAGGLSFHKHSIRRVFHRQLKQLWKIEEGLQAYTIPRRHSDSHEIYLEPYNEFGYQFVPLVRRKLKLSCSLDILFLRNDPPSSGVISAGDIDNRIKTLIDCLRRPKNEKELPSEYSTPKDDECPFYCLLEDDDQIGNFAVKADTLLDPTITHSEVEKDQNFIVELVIMVEIHPSVVTWGNLVFV